MHAVFQLSALWALAFASLSLAIVLLGLFYSLIGDGLELLSLGKEILLAAAASLIEAVSVWLVLTYVPAATRALFLPALVVALLYKVAHMQDWGRLEIFLLLIFQAFIAGLGAALFFGQFLTALVLLAGFAVILFVVGVFVRSFGD